MEHTLRSDTNDFRAEFEKTISSGFLQLHNCYGRLRYSARTFKNLNGFHGERRPQRRRQFGPHAISHSYSNGKSNPNSGHAHAYAGGCASYTYAGFQSYTHAGAHTFRNT